MHLHIDSVRAKPPHMHLTPELYQTAAARHPDLAKTLEVTYSWDNEGFADFMKSADILFAQRFPTEDLATVAPNLKWINVPSAGIEYLMPMDWLPESVVLTNISGTHAPKAAEFVTMAVLMLNARLPAVIANQRDARWEQLFSTRVAGKTVTIVGLGNMGRAAARSLRSMGVQVRGVRRSAAPDDDVDEIFATDALADALDGADFLVVAAPLTAETRGMIDAAMLDRLKPGAGVVNIGRGPIIDYDALSERLESGRLGGAVLDVFAPEPLPADSPLWGVRNLVVTPHISSDDAAQYLLRALDIFFDNLQRYLDEAPMRNVIDRDLGY
ncbi:MAG: D-2-hydroxyacid dehydrogenase [Alphaproteobacteria bacterium]|nr:D-2-hydroxyacid dehydrogenase [Alphaproteobacteria bacterium]